MNKLTVTLILLSTLFSLTGCAGLEPASEDAGMGIKGKEEVLVLRDISGGLQYGLHYYDIRWCGNNAFLMYGGEAGIKWIDFNGKKVIISTSAEDYPEGCTPDGRWIFYRDRAGSRVYKDKLGRVPENVVDDGPGWHGFVSDLYRYEVSTGRRQKFAVVRGDSSALISPDGLKVLLGNRHDSTIKMPEPEWEAVWLTNEWLYGSTYWFPDSSGIVTNIWDNGYTLGVEFFGKEAWSKEFNLDMMRTRKEYDGVTAATSVFLLGVDEKNMLHFIAIDSLSGVSTFRNKYNFFRCKIEGKDLTCSFMGGFEEEEGKHIDVFESFEILSNQDMVFKYQDGNCIRRTKSRETVAECIAGTRLEDEVYRYINMVGVSPDERRLAVRRGKSLRRPNGRFDEYQYDLVVIELEKD